jgi:hypothetical protein
MEKFPLILGVFHKLRNALGGGGQRFVMKPFKNIGICTVLRYEEGGGSEISENALRIILTTSIRHPKF